MPTLRSARAQMPALLAPLVAAGMVLGAAATPSPAPSPGTVEVVIQDYADKAPSATIRPGTTVIWTNKDDDPHTVTSDGKLFDSKGLGQGDTYRFTFDKPGRYPYHCAAHPFMKGVIIVAQGGSQ